jgi:small subunit ribosomal protein S17
MEETINNQETPSPEGTPAAATSAPAEKHRGRRTEKVGIVTSDKMMKTVVVRVDRLVKHPIYKRYVRKRTKFMAHNEIEGVSIGDQVRIVETRPLSTRKRWRVVEVLRKASK